ncbi:MAG: tRNA (adenosine(37)-N6)-dimethylallyltransferase MiaA, partial [Kiritimatiellia bacterium]
MNTCTPLYFLSGPTASGKTAAAHLLAEKMNLRLLSVDSMMVYRGMNIGTAKPTPGEISRYSYAGLDLVEAGSRFSTGSWLHRVSAQLDERPTLAVGGTGLYFRGLIDGLSPELPATDAPPSALPVTELQRRIASLNPDALQKIADPGNPRRLERALQWLEAGNPLPDQWDEKAGFPLPVLRLEVEELNRRIYQRAKMMLEQGLLEETRQLSEQGLLTGTAAQAIGYGEALKVLQGEWSPEQALEQIATRTRRYAKRQRTWFRNQMDARWIDIGPGENPEFIADKIARVWQETGPFLF